MNVPPAMLSTIEVTKTGWDWRPMPMPMPVDSISDKTKNMKNIAFLDLVWCCPRVTPRDMQATAWWMDTPIMRFTNYPTVFCIPRAIPSKIEWKPSAMSKIIGAMLTPQTRTFFSIDFPWYTAAPSSWTLLLPSKLSTGGITGPLSTYWFFSSKSLTSMSWTTSVLKLGFMAFSGDIWIFVY